MNKTERCILEGISTGMIMILFSYPIHGILFEKHWGEVSIMRMMDAWQVIPGMSRQM